MSNSVSKSQPKCLTKEENSTEISAETVHAPFYTSSDQIIPWQLALFFVVFSQLCVLNTQASRVTLTTQNQYVWFYSGLSLFHLFTEHNAVIIHMRSWNGACMEIPLLQQQKHLYDIQWNKRNFASSMRGSCAVHNPWPPDNIAWNRLELKRLV